MSIAEDVDKLNVIVTTDHGMLSSASRPIVERICQEFASDPGEACTVLPKLSRPACGVLLQYGGICSVEAVRENSIARLRSGLTALVIENGVSDIRDSIRLLAKFFHSACLLKQDTMALFSEFAGRSRSEALAFRIREFSFSPGTPSARLRRYGICALGSGATFRYVDDESMARAMRMYIRAPGMSLPQKLRFIVILLHQQRHKWQFWKRE
jgi:hypothetical protein